MTAGPQRTEALLRSAAETADWPPTPDLRAAVVARITGSGAEATWASAPAATSAPGRPRIRLVRALAVALVALLVLAGVAAALGFRLPGLDIERVDVLPPAGTGFDLGSPVPLAEARDEDAPRILVPDGLPEPATAYVLGAGTRRMVTLAWRAAEGARTLPGTDLSLAITALPGRTDEAFLSKLLGPATMIEPVDVDGDRGWWIAGAPHDLLVMRPDGSTDIVTSRLAGDTLVFVRDETLYRIESALGRDATLGVAATLH